MFIQPDPHWRTSGLFSVICFYRVLWRISMGKTYFLFGEQIPGSGDTKSKNECKYYFDGNYTTVPPLNPQIIKIMQRKRDSKEIQQCLGHFISNFSNKHFTLVKISFEFYIDIKQHNTLPYNFHCLYWKLWEKLILK